MYFIEKGEALSLCFFSEGIPWGLYNSSTDARLVTGDPNAILNTPGILMQFTGLKDKNGKEIYEGDLLYCKKTSEMFPDEDRWISDVRYSEASFTYRGDDPLEENECLEEMEVIGNIYENPELLTD